MKRFSLFLASFGVLISTTGALAQDKSTQQPPGAQAVPVQAADYSKCFQPVGTSDYYFGTIDPGTPVTHTFEFKNTCSSTVEIDRAQASCGCTAAIVSEKVVKPGTAAKIEVKFTPPQGSRGKVSKTVSLYLKGETTPHTVLRFSADIKTDLDIQPTYINLLGAEVGKPITGKATVKNVTDKDIEIVDIPMSIVSYADTSKTGMGGSVSIPMKNGTVTPTKFTLKPNEMRELVVELTPEYKGQVNGSLRVKTEKTEAFVQVFGVVREKAQTPVDGATTPKK